MNRDLLTHQRNTTALNTKLTVNAYLIPNIETSNFNVLLTCVNLQILCNFGLILTRKVLSEREKKEISLVTHFIDRFCMMEYRRSRNFTEGLILARS